MSDNIQFVDKNEKTVEEKSQRQSRIPADYIPVKLSTLGKLDAPAVLHVRDYTGQDILTLSMANESNVLRKLIDVLNDIVFEGFDCAYLHEQELEEIMLNVLANFWSPIIHDYPFPYTNEEYESIDEERKTRILKGLEKLTVDISVPNLKTNPIREDFREPIIIKSSNKTVYFSLPRIVHYFKAQEYIESKYEREYQEFHFIDKLSDINDEGQRQNELSKISRDILLKYKEFNDKRSKDYIIAKQAQLIQKIGSKTYESIEDKVKAYSLVTMQMWNKYNSVMDEFLNFGVDHNVEMVSPIDGKLTTRRCLFRPVDVIPSNDSSRSGEYTVLFGE